MRKYLSGTVSYLNKSHIVFLLIITAGITGCGSKEKPMTLGGCSQWIDGSTADPYELLKNSGCFRIGGVGPGGNTPPEEIALGRLMKQKDASAILEKLFAAGTAAGQCYAILGMRIIDRIQYEKLISQIGQDSRKVDIQSGCLMPHGTMQQIIRNIDAGEYDTFVQHQ